MGKFADEQEILHVYQNKNNERTVIVEGGTYGVMKNFKNVSKTRRAANDSRFL